MGVWRLLAHLLSQQALPRGLIWLGLSVGWLWCVAFVTLGLAGFPAGGPQGQPLATLGFAAAATAYFASMVWAMWLGRGLMSYPRVRD